MQFTQKTLTPSDFSSSLRLQKYLAEPDKLSKVAEFREWLSVFLIEKGQYRITQKGYSELGPEACQGKDAAKAAVVAKVAEMIRGGKAAQLFENGIVECRKNHSDWSNFSLRSEVLRKFVGGFDDPKKIEWGEFSVAGLGGIIKNYYSGTPYLVFVDLGISHPEPEFLKHAKTMEFKVGKFYPWEIKITPNNLFDKAENRIAATKWLIWKIQKKPVGICKEDFEENGLFALIRRYHGSNYLALAEAGYAYASEEIMAHSNSNNFETAKIYPWELVQTPDGFFRDIKMRKAATKWVASKVQKQIEDLNTLDFKNNGLSGLVNKYKHSQITAEALHA